MQAIHVRTKIDSETLHLPELRALIGKPVEIMIVELAPVSREEFFAKAVHMPDTPEGRAAQQTKFRAWRQDPRFERFWPSLNHYLAEDAQPQDRGGEAKGGAECIAGVVGQGRKSVQ